MNGAVVAGVGVRVSAVDDRVIDQVAAGPRLDLGLDGDGLLLAFSQVAEDAGDTAGRGLAASKGAAARHKGGVGRQGVHHRHAVGVQGAIVAGSQHVVHRIAHNGDFGIGCLDQLQVALAGLKAGDKRRGRGADPPGRLEGKPTCVAGSQVHLLDKIGIRPIGVGCGRAEFKNADKADRVAIAGIGQIRAVYINIPQPVAGAGQVTKV